MFRFSTLLIIYLISLPVQKLTGEMWPIPSKQTTVESSDESMLKVTLISPVGSTEGIREAFKILVGFNQPMTSLQPVPREETEGPLEIDPPIYGKYRWLGTKTLAFIPYDTLPSAMEFKVTLKKEKIESLSGMQLIQDTSWTFETVRPQLLNSLPRHRQIFVDRHGFIYLYFNMEMSPEKVEDKIQIIATHGYPSGRHLLTETPNAKHKSEIVEYRVRNLEDYEKQKYPLKGWENERTLVLEPLILPPESKIDVHLYPGLKSKYGNLGSASERVITFNTYNIFRLVKYSQEIMAGEKFYLCFSNPVSIEELLSNIIIEPEIEIPDTYRRRKGEGTNIDLNLPFNVRSEYEIHISNKLRDKFDNKLDKDYNFILKIGDYRPNVEMPTGISVIESKGDLRFPVNFLNVDSVYLEALRIDIDTAVTVLKGINFTPHQRYKTSRPFDISKYWKVNTRKNYRNQWVRLPIELDRTFRQSVDLLFIQLDDLRQNLRSQAYRYLKAFLMINDMGVTWKYSPENSLVWVTSLNSTEPLKGVDIQLRDDSNRVLCQGKSDEDGLCLLPGWTELLPKENPKQRRRYGVPKLWLTLQNEGSAIFSNRWDFGIAPWRFNIGYRWSIGNEEYSCYMFTEKGLYKAGETVHLKGIIRSKQRGKWVISDIRRISLTIENSRSEEILIDTLDINEYGSFSINLLLLEDSPTGIYRIKATLPEKERDFYHWFRVEAYKPAEFEVKVQAERDTFLVGEEFSATVTAKYLFGMPMKDAPVTWNLVKDNYYIRYPKYKTYRFGRYQIGRGRKTISSGKGNLDSGGLYSVKAILSADDIKSPSILTFEATVTAPNMRTVSGRQNWIALPANLLIGLKTSEYLYIPGDTVEVSMIAVRPSGEKVKNRNVQIKIFKKEWRSIKKARFGGRYEWVSETIETEKQSMEVYSRHDSTLIRFVPDEPGHYIIVADAEDEINRKMTSDISFYVSGRGFAGWEMRDDDIIELVCDKEVYQIGDTARIMVKSPYDSANALITMEREFILDKFLTEIIGNADYIEVPIDSSYLPNVYVCVTLIRGRVKELTWDEKKGEDLGKPQFKIGYVNLIVDPKEKHLQVSLQSEKEEYQPGDTITVNYSINDCEGEPVNSAELALFVVDLGVLNLIDFKTPNPFDYFYGIRPLSVRTVESRLHIIGERNYGEKGEERGGGGGVEGISYREKFIATAFYEASLITDKQGKGSATFVLPDNLTKFRIMAVAQTKDSKFGSGEKIITVNLPFMLTESLPRFVRLGDEFNAGCVVHNRTGKRNTARIDCEVEGVKLIGKNSYEVRLMPNESKEVLFSFKTEQIGKAIFKFKGYMAKEKDALKLVIPVENPPFTEAVATFCAIDDSIIESLYVPSKTYENLGGLEVLLSSSIIAGIENKIRFLMNFPYECLEQKLSRILPLIVGEDIINDFELAPVTGQALRDTVQSVLDEIGDYQRPDGGFDYYKDCQFSAPYLSIYTMYVLKRAKDNGYKIDPVITNKGRKYLKKVLRFENVDWSYPYNENARLTTKTFCLYVLSMWGDREKTYATLLFERREQLSIFAKTLLLKAGRNLDMGEEFENELSRIILNKIKLLPTTAHFEESENRGWTFPSPGKVTAFVIQAFTELDISFPYISQTINWLVDVRNRLAKPTTHENAFVFDAFQTYYMKFEKAEPDFIAKIILGEREIVNQIFKERRESPLDQFSVSIDSIPKDTLLPIKISKIGKGRLYYTLRFKYALKEIPIAFDEGFYIWKEILTLDNREVKTFSRGELYKVILHVVVPETRLFGIVDDPLPGGFEVVNPRFVTESQQTREEYGRAKREVGRRWWGSFDHQEVYDDRVILVGKYMLPGEHNWVYFVKASTSGEFLLPATKVQEMYYPEVFGSTPQKFISIE